MTNIKKARAKKIQNLREEKPVGAPSIPHGASGGKISTSEVMQRRESLPPPRNALIEIMPTIRQELIAVAAYYKAEKRGFTPGSEVVDWLEAEKEIDRLSRLM